MRKFNNDSMHSDKLEIINMDGFNYLEDINKFFDVIIVDLPDPKSVELNKLYTKEFYQLALFKLRPNGMIITQAGSPYYATKAFKCIDKTMLAAGFNTLKLHNQVLTLGEWGWILGSKTQEEKLLKKRLQSIKYDHVKTRWINNEAMYLISSFGKEFYKKDGKIDINTINNPVLYQYYISGNWDLY